MSLQELFQAMGMFKEGLTQMSVARGISTAQEQMNELNATATDELEKRSALQGIANNLALNLGKTGAPVHQIQSAVGAIAPAAIRTPEDAMMQGGLAGKKGESLMNLGREVDMMAAAPAFEQQKRSQDFQSKENAIDRAARSEMAAVKKSPRTRNMTQAEIKEISTLEHGESVIGETLAAIEGDPKLAGILAGRIPMRGKIDPSYAALKMKLEQQFNAYRQQITGAAASDKELETLKAAMPNLTDSPSEFKAKARVFMQMARSLRNRRLRTLDKVGVNIGDLTYEEQQQQEQQQQERASESATPDAPAAGPTGQKRSIFNYQVGK
jgi:hypothetical protein